jgi:hypothetical protein
VTIPDEGKQLDATESDPEIILDCLRHGSRISFERLMALLLEERNGILAWMLEGTREFIKRGLRLEPCASILAATENYFADEDVMGRFVKDWCEVVPVPSGFSQVEIRQLVQTKGSGSDLLHRAFGAWAQFGKYTWGKQKVTQRLEKVKGVVAIRGTGNRMFLNLGLNDAAKQSLATLFEAEPAF